MVIRILANTPLWVWGLLLALIALGLTQWQTRVLTLRRATVLPATMVVLSVVGTVSAFPSRPIALAFWAISSALVVAAMRQRPVSGATFDPVTARLTVVGSPGPLLLILGIFLLRYAVGVLLAMLPELASNSGFAAVVAALYGAVSGIFVARAANIRALASRPPAATVSPPSAPRILLAGLAGLGVGLASLLAALIAFGTAPPPPPLPAMADITGGTYADLPAVERFSARDGMHLAYRAYRVEAPSTVAVLVHGSAGDSRAMHALGRALRAAGVAAYAIDVRGHGESGRRGDIDYVGQIDDDLADFTTVVDAAHPGARKVLVGHSSGGGFALRVAGGPQGDIYDAYVLLAPMLHQNAPTTRPNAGGWAAPDVPRIFGLSVLESLGLPWFQQLSVIAFAVPAKAAAGLTPRYSYRLQKNFRPREDYQADVRGVRRPLRVWIGADDELFVADRYASLFGSLRPDIEVGVLPRVSHVGIVARAEALSAVIEDVRAGVRLQNGGRRG